MALIRCPECGEDVSGVANIAKSCPICGAPIHLPFRNEGTADSSGSAAVKAVGTDRSVSDPPTVKTRQ